MRWLVAAASLILAGCERPEPPTVAEIEASCDREFGVSSEASRQCQIEILSKEVDVRLRAEEATRQRRVRDAERAIR